MQKIELVSRMYPVEASAEDLGGLPWRPLEGQDVVHEGDLVLWLPEGPRMPQRRNIAVVLKCNTLNVDLLILGLNRVEQGVPHWADQRLTADSIGRRGVFQVFEWVKMVHDLAKTLASFDGMRKEVAEHAASVREIAQALVSEQPSDKGKAKG